MTELYNDIALELWFWLWMNNLPSDPAAFFYTAIGVIYVLLSVYTFYYVIIIKPCLMALRFLIDRFVTMPRFVSAY